MVQYYNPSRKKHYLEESLLFVGLKFQYLKTFTVDLEMGKRTLSNS